MAITTLDQVIAGMQYPREIVKAATPTLVAGRPHSLFYLAGSPPAAVAPANVAITSSSVANPTVITTATHGLATGDQISISGHTGSTPALDGVHTATVLTSTTFTIPVDVTVGGTGGVMCSINKGAGSGTPGIRGVVLTSFPGQIPFTNPESGKNTYLARFQGQATIAGSLLLCDRLWHNGGISPVITTEQLFNGSAQIPARDGNGANLGNGVLAAVEISAAMGSGTPTLTLKYTNSEGIADKTATNIIATVASAAIGVFYMIGLAAGDTGIQKAQSLTLSVTWTSGTIHVVLYRILARLEIPLAWVPNAIDALTSGFPRLFDNTVPFLVWIPTTTTATVTQGHVIWTQG